jgi:hypothetical protein
VIQNVMRGKESATDAAKNLSEQMDKEFGG